jgi:hypothetical protein
MLSAFATLTGDAKLSPDIGQLDFTAPAGLADLLVGNLTANTNVHSTFLNG